MKTPCFFCTHLVRRLPTISPHDLTHLSTSQKRSPGDYTGLRHRYANIIGAALSVFAHKDVPQELRRRLPRLFNAMMRTLFRQRGALFSIDIVTSSDAMAFIHTANLDAAFEQVPMHDAMRRRLSRSNFIFSGMKALHELHEAFPSLVEENGVRKPFKRFLNKTYKSKLNHMPGEKDRLRYNESASGDTDTPSLIYDYTIVRSYSASLRSFTEFIPA